MYKGGMCQRLLPETVGDGQGGRLAPRRARSAGSRVRAGAVGGAAERAHASQTRSPLAERQGPRLLSPESGTWLLKGAGAQAPASPGWPTDLSESRLLSLSLS